MEENNLNLEHNDQNDLKNRNIRSFVLRQGRMTKLQERAYDLYANQYLIDKSQFQQLNKNPYDLFKNPNQDLIVEIGFGMGTATAEIARGCSHQNFIGIEVHSPGVGNLLNLIGENQLENLKIIQHDAFEVIKDHLKPASLSGMHIFFPDPWHKKRHNKRRLIKHDFINLIKPALKSKGYVHIATDWEDYAIWIQEHFNEHQADFSGGIVERPNYRPLTKFEQRGLNLGHGVWDLIYIKS